MSTPQQHSLYRQSEASHFLTPLLHHCFQTKNLRSTKILHAHTLISGLFFTSLSLHTNLILSYAPHLHSNLQTLTNLLNSIKPTNPLPFNSIISSFSRHGFPFLSLWTTSFMQVNNIPFDNYTLCSSLTASSSIKSISFGEQLHTHVVKSGWLSSVYVGSSLVDFYAKLSAIYDASKVFDEIPLKNIVCVNAFLSGLADAKMWAEGLSLVRKLHILGLDYDQFTLSAVLRVCAGLSALELGRQVHGNLIRKNVDVESDVFLQSSLIEMYGKCGFVEKAQNVFDLVGFGRVRERKRDVVLWTSMISAYGRNGWFKDVIGLYELMVMNGVRPDGVVFIAVISACGHTGNVSLGLKYFESMVHEFGLQPNPEHYSCVVDLLCRAGELEKAWKLVSENYNCYNSKGSVSMWGALLSACSDNGNVEMGKLAAERALELEPGNVGIYVLLSNLYASVGMWNEIEELRKLMKERGLQKDVGCSWLELTN
ncbi:Pentatricopeptide repeat [Macleaya cordata]|uniref:Pentatricopeptide repeat n=1 Tax=Macleaya cordata TaxID=56857 RepID=A0A200QQW1_MACCD|nr:Pentatricopeptide repeat [Macleaya cordata]